MMQSPRRDAGHFGELLDSEHVANINPDVTLMSRLFKSIYGFYMV
jgi:hypothetical protein